MKTRVISLVELQTLADAGRIAVRANSTFGQTEAGHHSASSAERVISLRPCPSGLCSDEHSLIVPADQPVYEQDGFVWWGSGYTLRVLPERGALLAGEEVLLDPINLTYQRSLLR